MRKAVALIILKSLVENITEGKKTTNSVNIDKRVTNSRLLGQKNTEWKKLNKKATMNKKAPIKVKGGLEEVAEVVRAAAMVEISGSKMQTSKITSGPTIRKKEANTMKKRSSNSHTDRGVLNREEETIRTIEKVMKEALEMIRAIQARGKDTVALLAVTTTKRNSSTARKETLGLATTTTKRGPMGSAEKKNAIKEGKKPPTKESESTRAASPAVDTVNITNRILPNMKEKVTKKVTLTIRHQESQRAVVAIVNKGLTNSSSIKHNKRKRSRSLMAQWRLDLPTGSRVLKLQARKGEQHLRKQRRSSRRTCSLSMKSE